MKKLKNICYKTTNHERFLLDIYLPDCDSFPVFVYFHGGGIVAGNKEGGKWFEALCEKGVAVVSANYRLYPEAQYPDFLWDAAAAVAWAKSNMPEYGNVEGIFVGGSSAGGYLTQMLCFDGRFLKMHKIDADEITGYIMDAGQPTVHFNVLAERGIDSRRVIIDEAAPIYHICEERNYAPMLILVADNDMENRLEQTMLLCSTLKHFGHESKYELRVMENCTHTSYTNDFDESGKSIFAEMVYKFIKKHI